MRKHALMTSTSIACLLAFAACSQQSGDEGERGAAAVAPMPAQPVEAPAVTTVQWVDSIRDMGVVKEGERIEIPFRFRNTGQQQLVIHRVDVACGCTVAEKPEQPIGPGREGVIKASFDSKGRPGPNHKTVTVYANTPEATHTLIFDVDVRGRE